MSTKLVPRDIAGNAPQGTREDSNCMGKVLFLADIHGNMPALLALSKEIERIKPDQVWFVGDAVGKGPQGAEAVDWVREHCDRFIQGNWDDGVCKNFHERKFMQYAFFFEQVGEERIKWLESLPFEDEILISGFNIRVVHGRPSDRIYQANEPLEELEKGLISNINGKKYDAFICADCHMPFVRECGGGYAINTGSVGDNLGGVTRAHAVVISGEIGGTEKSGISFELLSIPYDKEEAIRIADTYPELPNLEAYKNELRTGHYSR